MEFKIITNLSAWPQIIETNAEELKTWLREKLTHYNALVVTPESIAAAKDDKAALNKLRAALEERRKEVKKQCMAPYEDFERKYKELLALIDEPICKIDTQIKALDEQEQKQKYDRLREYFANCEASMDTGVKIDFDSILNPKWRNKTAKESALQQEIYDTVCRIIADVEELRSYYSDSPHYTAILNRYSHIIVCHPKKERFFIRRESVSGTADLTNIADNVILIHRVGKDFEVRATEFFGEAQAKEYMQYSTVIEVSKNRQLGVTDYLVGLYYEMESKRLKNSIAENVIYGWYETATQSSLITPNDDFAVESGGWSGDYDSEEAPF